MDIDSFLHKVCYFIYQSCSLPTALTPLNTLIKRPYATVTLINDRPLTNGKTFVNQEGDLVKEWQAECLLDVNFYMTQREKIDEIYAKISSFSALNPSFKIVSVNPFSEISSRFQGVFEKRYTLQINVLANFSYVLEKQAPYIEHILVQEEIKE